MSVRPEFKLSDDLQSQIASLRGLSALIVLVGHGLQVFIYPRHPHVEAYVGYFSQSAVMVFFVLSGFLIGRSILMNRYRNGTFNAYTYIMDRLARLLPPLVLAVLMIVILSLIAPFAFPSGTQAFLAVPNMSFARTEFTAQPTSLIGALFFLNGFLTTTPTPDGPLWSLPYEFWFYVFAGALFAWPSRPIASALIMSIALFVSAHNDQFFSLSVVWVLGFAIAVAHSMKLLQARGLALTLIPMFSALFCQITYMASSTAASAQQWTLFYLLDGFCFSAYLGLVLCGRTSFPHYFSRAAPFSYTLYVTHFPIMLFVFGVTQSAVAGSTLFAIAVALFAMAIALSFAVPAARAVERKFLFSPNLNWLSWRR